MCHVCYGYRLFIVHYRAIEALPGLCHDSLRIVVIVYTDTAYIQLPLHVLADQLFLSSL